MKNQVSFRNAAFFTAGGFVAALFGAGAAHAITDTVFQYSAAKTGFKTFQGQTFTPRISTAVYNASVTDGLTTSAGNFFTTPLHLPQGATITAIVAWYKTKTSIQIVRQLLSNAGPDLAANKSCTDSSGTLKVCNVNLSSTPIVIDNARYSYSIQVFVDSSGAFYNARVTYRYNNAGD